MKKYIEIVCYESGEVVHQVDVSNHSERSSEKVERGMNINLNHDKYYTREQEYKTKQEIIQPCKNCNK